MSKLQLLNAYVTERLTAAATEISVAIETTVVELHEEISRSTEENDRLRRLLDLVFNRQIKLHRVNPDCSAAQSENMESDDEVERGGLLSGSKTLKSKTKQTKNGERFHTSAGGRTAIMFPCLTSSSQTDAAPYCCKAEQNNTDLSTLFPGKMSKLQLLNVYVTERLTAAVAEISVEVERTVVELYEEISRSKEENDRLRRLLDLVFNPEIKLHKAVNPDCSAAQSENMESDDEVERGGLLSGSKTLKSMTKQTKNGERFHSSAGGRTETMLPCLTSSSQTDAAPYCWKVCRKTFVSVFYLIYHVRKIHTEHKECQCGVCVEKA
ncbi:unnamed protein product [Coregonus sp. 'balchen']|nr:unnamed protein product [Coregonus sp. 'balchen']